MAKEKIEDAEVIEDDSADQQSQEKTSSGPRGDYKPKESNTDLGEDDIVWSDNDVTDMLDEPPLQSTAQAAEEDIVEPTAEEKAAYMNGEYEEEEEKLSLEDLRVTAELVIEMVDALNSTAVGAWVKEPSSTFELTEAKKKTLTGLLAKVFFRYQAKLGPVASLVIAMLLYFGMTWKMGWDIKKSKEEAAAQKIKEERQKKLQEKKERFRNRILAAIDIEKLSLN